MDASEVLVNVFFGVFALAAVAGAVGVAASRNIVRSAFALLAVLFSAAALYAIMKADFIAAAQVLIYVGGILVLIIFAVMLTHRITDVKISNDSTHGWAPALGCAGLCLWLLLMIWQYDAWARGAKPVGAKAGDVPVSLSQFQADGRTGLAWGAEGVALEDRVVVAVHAEKPPAGATAVEVEAATGRGWEKTVKADGALSPAGTTRVTLKGLGEGPWRWRARFVGGGKDSGWTRPDSDVRDDFNVQKGVTKPVARALAGPYLFAFEVVSVLLLAALVGAAFLARKEVKE